MWRRRWPRWTRAITLCWKKPISPLLDECLALQKKAHGRTAWWWCAMCCAIPNSTARCTSAARGAIGRIESLDAVENVAYWHYAHSYVRGNWRRAEESSPMILAKSCHDMDIIRWLMGVPSRKRFLLRLSDWFRAENALDGKVQTAVFRLRLAKRCPYDAEKIHIFNDKSGIRSGNDEWPCSVLVNKPTEEKLYDALRTGPTAGAYTGVTTTWWTTRSSPCALPAARQPPSP